MHSGLALSRWRSARRASGPGRACENRWPALRGREGGREGGRERNGWSGRETADQCRNGRACESESDSPAQFEDGMECLATPVTSRSRPDRRFSHRCGLQTHDSNGWDTVRLTKSLLELWARERRQRLHALMERPERGVPACVPPAPGWVSAML